MSRRYAEIEDLLESKEDENREFKEAKGSFSFDDLAKYCAALANEGGGEIVLGVSDRRPRRVVGTRAFSQPEQTVRGLCERLHLGIGFEVIQCGERRVLIFRVPNRPVGSAVQDKGVRWTRAGDSIVPMCDDRLRQIFSEGGHDFSADVCRGATISDLDPGAIEEFRRRWINKSGNDALATLLPSQLLSDAEVLVEGEPTYAAMVLFGKRRALGRHLGQAEVIFEYRSSEAPGAAQKRNEFREGFFAFYEQLWEIINLRNDTQHYEEGLFVFDIPTFAERTVREAILNAVSHRDYQLGGSVFVRQYPRRLEVVSPGGFPTGINLENILDRQSPRNRRIADLFSKCGLVERSGQGMNLMYEECVRHSKPTPDFSGTDAYQVALTLHGTVQNPEFLRFLEKVEQEKLATFSTEDWLILGDVSQNRKIPERYKGRLENLLDLGVFERVTRDKFMLSRKYYRFIGQPGVYTRKRGLDRGTNKELLLKHIRESGDEGCPLGELLQVLPQVKRDRVRYLVSELAGEGRIHVRGRTRGAKWHFGPKRSRPERGDGE